MKWMRLFFTLLMALALGVPTMAAAQDPTTPQDPSRRSEQAGERVSENDTPNLNRVSERRRLPGESVLNEPVVTSPQVTPIPRGSYYADGGTAGGAYDSEIQAYLLPNQRTYTIGERVGFTFRVDQDAYVFLFSTDGQGRTRQLFPNAYDRQNYLRAGVTYTIPDRGEYGLVASEPAGREVFSLVATNAIYDWVEREYMGLALQREAFPVHRDRPGDFLARLERSRSTIARYGQPQELLTGWTQVPVEIHRQGFTGEPAYPAYPDGRPPYRDPYYPPPPDREPYYPYPGHYAPPADDRGDYGKLVLRSEPTAAEIFIDGIYFGRTPRTFELPEGRYELVLRRPGYRDYERIVRLERDRTETYRVRLREN
ncbi:MAG: DUF4384 domain-containing protein [Sumerlaeia bacterium]